VLVCDLYLILREKQRLYVFLRNMLQGRNLRVNSRRSINRTGQNNIIGNFVILRSPNSVRIIEKNLAM